MFLRIVLLEASQKRFPALLPNFVQESTKLRCSKINELNEAVATHGATAVRVRRDLSIVMVVIFSVTLRLRL